ncbi:MAG: type II toxin-antitoxin system VapC family toxin [Gammaproteobacteria bacterium]|nr:type II toxin-antitoxin system VapC family toxin [Gammaproteobacteria bacterium]
MKIFYLLDTNILSESLKQKSHAGVVKSLLDNTRYIATAAPVVYEIVQGAERLPESKKRTEIFRYLDEFVYPNVPILPYDKQAAALHGELQGKLILMGKTAPLIDGQIAAIAQLHQLILVTRNTDDFENFSALTVENWFRR